MEIINYNKVVYKTIDELDEKDKQHIIDLNVAFRSDAPKNLNDYRHIVKEEVENNFITNIIIYENKDFSNKDLQGIPMSYRNMLRVSDCFINHNGWIEKNRYGDEDVIRFRG